MPPSQMWPSVLQAVLINTCTTVSFHLWTSKAYDNFMSHELFSNLTIAVQNEASAIAMNAQTMNGTWNVINGTDPGNSSFASTTAPANPGSSNAVESFYWRTLPRGTIVFVVVFSLQYRWHIWLERILPARPRRRLAMPEGSRTFDSGDGDETREAEVVKKWIDQGKVHRASLSWCNTFLKWVLDVTLGMIWSEGLTCLLDGILQSRPPMTVLRELKMGWVPGVAMSYLFLVPVVSLVSFIVVPAHKRIVFMAVVGLLASCFTGAFVHFIIPWSANNSVIRTVAETWIEGIHNNTAAATAQGPAGRRLGDEL